MLFQVKRVSGNIPNIDGVTELELTNKWGTDMAWVTEINTIEELIKFIKKCYKDVIIDTNFTEYQMPTISIYDDYNE